MYYETKVFFLQTYYSLKWFKNFDNLYRKVLLIFWKLLVTEKLTWTSTYWQSPVNDISQSLEWRKINYFLLLHEWVSYGVEKKIESANKRSYGNVKDLYVILFVFWIVTFWKCSLCSDVLIKIITYFSTNLLTILNKWMNSIQDNSD